MAVAEDALSAPAGTVAHTERHRIAARASRRLSGAAAGVVFVVALMLPLLILLFVKARTAVVTQDLFRLYGVMTTCLVLSGMTIAFRRYRDPARAAFESGVLGDLTHGELPFVSLIVAVKNEERLIERCVASLVDSTYPHREVIVINDGSDDGTAAVLDEFALRHPSVRVLHLPANIGKKRALAAGILESRGTLLIFTDSDSVIESSSVTRAVAAFVADPMLGGLSGHARALNSETNLLTKAQDVWYDGQFGIWKAAESAFGSVTCVSGPFAAFRREAIFNLIPEWIEDSFLGQSFPFATDRKLTGLVLDGNVRGEALKAKFASSEFVTREDYPARRWRVEYAKSILVWTEVPDTFRRFCRQQTRWKKSFLRSTWERVPHAWRRGPGAAGLYYTRTASRLIGPLVAIQQATLLVTTRDPHRIVLYLFGIVLVGAAMGAAFKIQNPNSSRWMLRPLMSLLNTIVLVWLIWWSAATIWRPTWSRG